MREYTEVLMKWGWVYVNGLSICDYGCVIGLAFVLIIMTTCGIRSKRRGRHSWRHSARSVHGGCCWWDCRSGLLETGAITRPPSSSIPNSRTGVATSNHVTSLISVVDTVCDVLVALPGVAAGRCTSRPVRWWLGDGGIDRGGFV